MTTRTLETTRTKVLSVAAAGLIGVFLVVLSGHVQAGALHDAAHDVRHATGFPCH